MTDPSSPAIELAIDRIWETLPPLWQRLRAAIRAYATENFNLSVEQFHTLRLVRRGLGSVSELAAEKRISRPAISQAVEALVQRGLLSRTTSLEDRRYIRLELTPEGQALMDAVYQHARAWIGAHMQASSSEDLGAVIQGLETLQRLFDEPAA